MAHSIDNICLRVPQVQAGTSVTLTGVNFFNIKAKVYMRRKGANSWQKKTTRICVWRYQHTGNKNGKWETGAD